MPNLIDYGFLSAREGALVLDGYVPAPTVSRSGVTIATGVDLGQRSKAGLRALGLPLSLVDKLTPYLGVTRTDAVRVLEKQPLRISLLEARMIDQAVKQDHVARLVASYNTSPHNTRKIDFFSLPAEAQTVIASVSFQYGTLATEAPRFWKSASAQDWPAAVRELRNFGDLYPTRRKLEADLLGALIPEQVTETVR